MSQGERRKDCIMNPGKFRKDCVMNQREFKKDCIMNQGEFRKVILVLPEWEEVQSYIYESQPDSPERKDLWTFGTFR